MLCRLDPPLPPPRTSAVSMARAVAAGFLAHLRRHLQPKPQRSRIIQHQSCPKLPPNAYDSTGTALEPPAPALAVPARPEQPAPPTPSFLGHAGVDVDGFPSVNMITGGVHLITAGLSGSRPRPTLKQEEEEGGSGTWARRGKGITKTREERANGAAPRCRFGIQCSQRIHCEVPPRSRRRGRESARGTAR